MPDPILAPGALAELLETIGGDRAFLGELIETYLADTPVLLAELRGGLTAGDAPAVRRAAHTLKSTSATFGATRLAGIGREIERAATADDLTGLGPSVEDAVVEFDRVTPPLQAAASADTAGVEIG